MHQLSTKDLLLGCIIKGKEPPLSEAPHLGPSPSQQAVETRCPLHVLTCSEWSGGLGLGFPENTHSYLARWEQCLGGVWAGGCSPPAMAAAAAAVACWNSPDGSDGMAPRASSAPASANNTKTVSVVTRLIPITVPERETSPVCLLPSAAPPPGGGSAAASKGCEQSIPLRAWK